MYVLPVKATLSLTGKTKCASVRGLISNTIHRLMETHYKWRKDVFNLNGEEMIKSRFYQRTVYDFIITSSSLPWAWVRKNLSLRLFIVSLEVCM